MNRIPTLTMTLTMTAPLVAAAAVSFYSLRSLAQPVLAPVAQPVAQPGVATQPTDPAVRSIVLPTIPTELPPGPAAGRDTVGTTCTACHSTRNILNQPAFPRQTWINEVNKMRTAYGAPVAEQQVPAIVDYLVSIRGIAEPKTQP